jgi:hypothetical protein
MWSDFCLIWRCQVLEDDPGAGFDVSGAQIVHPQILFSSARWVAFPS